MKENSMTALWVRLDYDVKDRTVVDTWAFEITNVGVVIKTLTIIGTPQGQTHSDSMVFVPGVKLAQEGAKIYIKQI